MLEGRKFENYYRPELSHVDFFVRYFGAPPRYRQADPNPSMSIRS